MQRFTPSPLNSAVVPAVVSGGMALASLVWLCPAARAETLTAWQFDPATQQLTLTLPTGVVPQYALAATGDRLVLTIPQTQLGNVPTTAIYDGPIQHIQLFSQGDGVEIALTLAPGVALAADPAQLVSVVAGAETRWVFTPLVAQVSSVAAPNADPEAAPGMIVELPPLPADPNLNWPYTGLGRLSISAANLMRPSNLDTFNTLPETLAIDPFNLGLPAVTEQVAVPSLEELDAAVGVPITSPTVVVPSLGSVANATTAPTTAPATAGSDVIATPPPSGRPNPGAVAAVPAEPIPAPSVQPAAPDLAQGMPQIDQETNGLAIPVSPAPAIPAPTVVPPTAPSTAAVPTVTTPTVTVPTVTVPTVTVPTAPPTVAAPTVTVPTAPPTVAAPTVAPTTAPTAAITTPPPTSGFNNPVAQVSNNPAPGVNAVEPPFLTVPPPTVNPSRVANQTPAANNDLLSVPTQPNPTATGVVIPPNLAAEPIPVAVAPDAAISFGQPLPGQLVNGADPVWGDRRLAPDTLIAAGSILELRYTGPASLALDPGTVHQEVLMLETEVRDPVTNGIVAPAGSQLIGQFKASGDGHQWVSQMLIAPDGQRIPFASTSDYVYNSPQVSGGALALGTGLGALALTLLTGFGGIGLLGGALIGATTVVGTAPQMLVIEPNQVIYAEVMQDVYRSMPIATAPVETQEWGAVPGTWFTP